MSRRLLLVLCLVVGAVVPVGAPAGASPPLPEAGDPDADVGSIVPLTPARVLDTRDGTGVSSAGAVGAGGVVDVAMLGLGGVPESGVAGVVLNVTATQPTAPSFVTVWPTGEALPTASSLNVLPGQTVPNLVVAKLGAGGKVSLFNKFGTTHLLADVAGWIPVGSDLTTLTPARILDTREPIGVAAAAPVGPGGVVELDVTGVGGVPDSDVGAVLLNVTATQASATSFVTVWPTGEVLPKASSLNMLPGQTVPNLVIAKVGAGGKVSLFNKFGTTHLLADVVAYTTAGSTLNPLTPARVLDTRDGTGAPEQPVGADGVISLEVLGVGGVPDSGVAAVALNVTVTAPTAPSFVAVWPTGIPQTDASALNMLPGETIPNLVIVPVGAGGQVELFNRFGSTDLIADVVAYITPPDGETAPSIAAETMVVTPDLIEAIVGDPDSDATITITLDSQAGVEVGSIIATEPTAGAPSGLLRRVTSITANPDGTITVTAERATIGEAIPTGSIDFTTSPEGATVRLIEASANTPFAAAVECGSAVKLKTDVDGRINPTADFKTHWENGTMQHARVTAGLDVEINFTAKATAEVTCETSKQLAVITLAPIVITIPPGIPLVFVPEVAVDIKLAGKVEGTIDGSAQYGVNMTAGLLYDATNGIDTIGAATPFVTSNWQAGATAEASLTLTPSLTIAAYGIGGPKAAFPMAVTADLDACRTPFWQIKSSIKPTFSLALASWLGGASIADTTYTLNENTIAEGGTPPPNPSGCDKTVEVIGHGARVYVTSRSDYHRRVEDDGEVILREDTDDRRVRLNDRFGGLADNPLRPSFDGQFYEQIWDVEGPVGIPAGPPPVDIGPYVAQSEDVARSATTSATGANSTSSASALLTFDQIGDAWTLVHSTTAAAATTAFPDEVTFPSPDVEDSRSYAAFADANASAETWIRVAGEHSLTVTPSCGLEYWVITAYGGANPGSLIDPDGCITATTIGSGVYRLRTQSNVEDNGGSSSTVSVTLTK